MDLVLLDAMNGVQFADFADTQAGEWRRFNPEQYVGQGGQVRQLRVYLISY